MSRTYLFVPPEEKSEVEALGALWDADSKRWYISSELEPAAFSRWLPDAAQTRGPDSEAGGNDSEFTISSNEAFVASARVLCRSCGAGIEVICIHCVSGTAFGEPLTSFTISDVWAMDESLVRQLQPWPTYRRMEDSESGDGVFANHCPRCGAPQEDLYLHSEPDEPFFNISGADLGKVALAPLAGTIRLSGDEHFEVD